MEKNTYNGKRGRDYFLVLAPHRDARLLVRKYSDTLIGAGLTGVFSFPWVAPLAVLSQPLCDEELKICSHSLREIIGRKKLFSAKTSITKFPANKEDMTLFGPCLDLAVTDAEFGQAALKIISLFSPLVIGAFLYPAGYSGITHNYDENPQLQPGAPFEGLEFRAAAVANMFWRPFKAGSQNGFKWKIGKLFWLPRPAKK